MATAGNVPPWSQNLFNLPNITFENVETFIKINSKTPKASDHRGFTLFDGGYIHKYEVQYSEKTFIRARCYHSQRKSADPHILKMCISSDPVKLEEWQCSCKAGKGFCQHIIALLYQTAHFKKKGCKVVPPELSRTSTNQKWGVPKRSEGFHVRPLHEVELHKVKRETTAQDLPKKKRKVNEGVRSTMYNPIIKPLMDLHMSSILHPLLETMVPRPQILDLLDSDPQTYEQSRFGLVPYGCTLASQHPEKKGDPFRDVPDFELKDLPLHGVDTLDDNQKIFFDGMKLPRDECDQVERMTRDQHKCTKWHEVRKNRLTASKAHRIIARRGNFASLPAQIKKPVRKTEAMSYGLEKEKDAVEAFSQKSGLETYPAGFVINPSAPHIGCSPDRRAYDPQEESSWGILEVKCPQATSFVELDYLKPTEKGDFKLKIRHEYYTQVMVQMGITGCAWCDFYVLCKEDYHWERIYFSEPKFQEMKEKIDIFFFKYFLPYIMSL